MKTMQVPKKLLENIAKAASTRSSDLTRDFIQGVNITPQYVEATDGYCLSRVLHEVPLEIDKAINIRVPDRIGDVKRFVKGIPGNMVYMFIEEDFISFSQWEKFNPANSLNLEIIHKDFIDTSPVVDNFKEDGCFKFCVNLKYLNKVSQAIYENHREEGVLVIEIPQDNVGTKPIRVKSIHGKSFAMVMPFKE